MLLSEPPLSPVASRERLTRLCLETFGCPAALFLSAATLSVYASGRTIGLAVDSGADASYIVPVYEGYAIAHATARLELGGAALSQRMRTLLVEQGLSFEGAVGGPGYGGMVEDIKEKLGYAAADRDAPANSASYTLPDGADITLGAERHRCVEVLFEPAQLGLEQPGLPALIQGSVESVISQLDFEAVSFKSMRRDLYGNIILSGGNTMFDGLADRLKREVEATAAAGEPAINYDSADVHPSCAQSQL